MWYFAGTLIWYHTQKNNDTQHTQGPLDRHNLINLYLHHLLCAHSSYIYYNEWIIHWYQKFTFFCKVFSFQKLFTCKSHVCWLDAIKLGSCETQIILIEMVETNSTHTHNKHSHKDNTGKSYYENKWYPSFLKQPPILPALPFLWEKSTSVPSLFLKNLENSNSPGAAEGWGS